jgi:mono/diheme cytochrome c family protein
MNAFIQPRHEKLWLAGKARNWEYAEYERHNIGGALRRLAEAVPEYKGQPMKDLIAVFATPQLAALDTAIKAKDPAAFKTAYEGLTTGCNQCHQATGHGMVVMQTPATDSFPDQVFRTVGP